MEHRSFTTPKIGQRKRPLLTFVWTVLMLLVGVGIGWFGYALAPQSLHALVNGEDVPLSLPSQMTTTSDDDVELIREERDKMRQRIVALERASQIDKVALQQLKKEIKDGQSERMMQEEEMAFLRGVATKDEEGEGLRVRNFRIAETSGDQVYKYRFTVTQSLSNREEIKGKILISLVGSQDGKKKTLELADVTDDKLESLKMGFKHFQDLDGAIKLPEGFTAKKFVIKIQADDGDEEGTTKDYDWVVNN